MQSISFRFRAGRAGPLSILAVFALLAACSSQHRAPPPDPHAFELPQDSTTEGGRPWPSGPLVKNQSDRAVEARVRDLLSLAGFSPFDVRVQSQRGRVTLAGDVNAEGAGQRLAGAVAQLKGVRAVQNELTVKAEEAPVVPAAVGDPRWFSALPSALALLAIVSALFFAKGNRRRRLDDRDAATHTETTREESSRVA